MPPIYPKTGVLSNPVNTRQARDGTGRKAPKRRVFETSGQHVLCDIFTTYVVEQGGGDAAIRARFRAVSGVKRGFLSLMRWPAS